MKKAYLFLATGFEEMEAIGTVDILRRGGINVTIISISGKNTVTGANGITMVADKLFDEADYTAGDAFILPGGGPGSQTLNGHDGVKKLILEQYGQNKLVAAICAAPLVLGGLGLLQNKKAICYPGIELQLTGAIITDKPAVKDGNIITGKGPGFVFEFALEILSTLQGDTTASKVAQDILLDCNCGCGCNDTCEC